MSASERIKGRRAEAEVARILRDAGFTVRGLESGGDHHAVLGTVRLHVEVKRQERGWRWAWAAQAMAEAPAGSIPVVIYRSNREPWTLGMPRMHRVLLEAETEVLITPLVHSRISGTHVWDFATLRVFLEAF